MPLDTFELAVFFATCPAARITLTRRARRRLLLPASCLFRGAGGGQLLSRLRPFALIGDTPGLRIRLGEWHNGSSGSAAASPAPIGVRSQEIVSMLGIRPFKLCLDALARQLQREARR